MMRALLLVVLLALWPISAQAEESPPNALQIGAAIATCMTESRIYPPGSGVELHGTIHEATLVDEYGIPFAILRRRPLEPTDDSVLANQPIQPPMAIELVGNQTLAHRRATMQYALGCFSQAVYFGQDVHP